LGYVSKAQAIFWKKIWLVVGILRVQMGLDHRHLGNVDCLMVHTACHVCFTSTVNDCSEKKENALEDAALVASTQQNLSNLYSLDIYGLDVDILDFQIHL
jgi:hypothetical protein